jgi:DNA repair exonuclease SbcCD ATPase subunit
VNRLTRIEIENFRGFGDARAIDIDADSVVITGPNGVGKTSLIDAITWVLTGRVTRLERHKERRTDDVLTNRYRRGASPKVTLAMVYDGAEVVITREGHASDVPTVEMATTTTRGNDAVAHALGFPTFAELQYALDTWGVLHQDSMRAVLEARPEEFQTRLRDILGLGVLGDFEAWLKAEVKAASDAAKQARERLSLLTGAVVTTRGRLQTAGEQIAQAVSPMEAREAFVAVAAEAKPYVRVRTPESSDLTPSVLLDEIRRLQTEITRRWASYQAVSEALDAAGKTEADLEELQRATDTATGAVQVANADLQTAETNLGAFRDRLQGLAALAAAALPYLGPTCPVCEQAIEPDAVRARLGSLLNETADQAALAALEATRDAARTAAQAAETRLAECQRAQRASQEHALEIARLRLEQDAQAQWFRAISADDELIPIATGTLSTEAMSSIGAELRRLETALERWQAAITASATMTQEPALRARLAEHEEQERQTRAEVERLAGLELTLKSLASAATEAVVDVTGQWLTELNPLFGAVYNRLAAHPTFTELGLEHDVYYGKGRTLPRVYDRLLDIGDNPQLVCSEGQLNIVALSYFIAFALSAGDRSLPFLIMDDPLQFMDEINVLGFADLCRQLRASRQVIVTTHDRRFARLLERKLRPRRTDESSVDIEFTAWERSGPRVKSTQHEPELVPDLLAVS